MFLYKKRLLQCPYSKQERNIFLKKIKTFHKIIIFIKKYLKTISYKYTLAILKKKEKKSELQLRQKIVL